MLEPRYPYSRQHARTFEWIAFYVPRGDRRYRRRCSMCRRFLARARKSSYCKGCQARRVQYQRVQAYEKQLRDRRAAWRASINPEIMQTDLWWIFFHEPGEGEDSGWLKKKYPYAFLPSDA